MCGCGKVAWALGAVERGGEAEARGLEEPGRGGLEQPRWLSGGHLHHDKSEERREERQW